VVQALAGVALLEFTQVKPRAEVISFAVQHGGTGAGGQVFKQVAQGQHLGVAQRIAFGGARQADHGNVAAHFELEVFLGHLEIFSEVDYGYE
jgi:ABC-type sulfate/molybdate transport systems ATPase subunit